MWLSISMPSNAIITIFLRQMPLHPFCLAWLSMLFHSWMLGAIERSTILFLIYSPFCCIGLTIDLMHFVFVYSHQGHPTAKRPQTWETWVWHYTIPEVKILYNFLQELHDSSSPEVKKSRFKNFRIPHFPNVKMLYNFLQELHDSSSPEVKKSRFKNLRIPHFPNVKMLLQELHDSSSPAVTKSHFKNLRIPHFPNVKMLYNFLQELHDSSSSAVKKSHFNNLRIPHFPDVKISSINFTIPALLQ